MNPELIGYVIHLEASDEFLAGSINPQRGAELTGWTKEPGIALTFKSLKKAKARAKKMSNGAAVAELYDNGNLYLVAKVE